VVRRLVESPPPIAASSTPVALVGHHVGDRVVAFFLVERLGSESAADRACISAARTLRIAAADVATRSGLEADEVVIRSGLHWGSTLYVGAITTGARSEVTALGDEVNEGARTEPCASGGRALASKDLAERLGPDDARALGLDPDRMTSVALADLPTATEKARRDALAVAVYKVQGPRRQRPAKCGPAWISGAPRADTCDRS
jgi:class 3 adenylate cyclase